ncbi:hypothetical protein CVT24_011014 [Panaeolus cyanescens]|uniref:Histone H4 n=1 Tax=Panaeolus cyanescens TaxID=181874 RepID=A0A409YVA9_9AGAR|nr:hypothetical protein CVT24_011014 [Panaeolus cyanescens]
MFANREYSFPVLSDEHIIETTANIWVGEHPAPYVCHSTLHRPTSNLVITNTSTLIGAVPPPVPTHPPHSPPVPPHLVPPRPRTRRGYRRAHPYNQARMRMPERYPTTHVVGTASHITHRSSSVPNPGGTSNEAARPVQGSIFLEPQNQSHVRYYDGYSQYPVGISSLTPPALSISSTSTSNPASSQAAFSAGPLPRLFRVFRNPISSFSLGNAQEVDRRQGKQQRSRTSAYVLAAAYPLPSISDDEPIGLYRPMRPILKPALSEIKNPSVRRVARKGGVKRMDSTVSSKAKDAMRAYLHAVVHDAVIYTENGKRKTLTALDVQRALRRSQDGLYGFEK